jgi:RNA polymerase primary sigma factor
MIESLNKMSKIVQRLTHERGEEPPPELIAEHMDVPIEKVRALLESLRDAISLDAPVGEDGGTVVGDFVEDPSAEMPDQALAVTERAKQTRALLEILSEREAKVLRMRFGIDEPEDLTLEEVGKSFELTRERIRQIETKALRKLRLPSGHRGLRGHIER